MVFYSAMANIRSWLDDQPQLTIKRLLKKHLDGFVFPLFLQPQKGKLLLSSPENYRDGYSEIERKYSSLAQLVRASRLMVGRVAGSSSVKKLKHNIPP